MFRACIISVVGLNCVALLMVLSGLDLHVGVTREGGQKLLNYIRYPLLALTFSVYLRFVAEILRVLREKVLALPPLGLRYYALELALVFPALIASLVVELRETSGERAFARLGLILFLGVVYSFYYHFLYRRQGRYLARNLIGLLGSALVWTGVGALFILNALLLALFGVSST